MKKLIKHTSQKIAIVVTIALLFNLIPGFKVFATGGDIGLYNPGFETGDFYGWTVNGNAFSVTSDTNWGWGGDFNHRGKYHVWGFKKAGDAGTGTLTSSTFRNFSTKYVDFLIGGGNDIDNLYVALVVNGVEVYKATGTNSETYRRVVWDISPYQYSYLQFKIVDKAAGSWGHINVDDFHTTSIFSDTYETLPNHDFEDGNLNGWIVNSGTAFSAGDVTTDSTYGDGTFDQSGSYHLWSFKDGGDADTGVMQSYFFNIGGRAKIDFLISGGDDINNLYVALVRASDGKELFKATGANTERYSRVTWDASVYIGEQVYVKIVDNATGGWGHINIDDLNVQATGGSITNDIEPPTAPTNLTITNQTGDSVTLSWTAATDNIGIKHYRIHCNGQIVATTTDTTWTRTNYFNNPYDQYYVYAVDFAGNVSPRSNIVVIQ